MTHQNMDLLQNHVTINSNLSSTHHLSELETGAPTHDNDDERESRNLGHYKLWEY